MASPMDDPKSPRFAGTGLKVTIPAGGPLAALSLIYWPKYCDRPVAPVDLGVCICVGLPEATAFSAEMMSFH